MVGGHVEEGEDFDTAVHREILEETGLPPATLMLEITDQFAVLRPPGPARRLAGAVCLAPEPLYRCAVPPVRIVSDRGQAASGLGWDRADHQPH